MSGPAVASPKGSGFLLTVAVAALFVLSSGCDPSPLGLTAAPPAVSTFSSTTVTTPGSNQVALTWTTVSSDILTYHVYYQEGSSVSLVNNLGEFTFLEPGGGTTVVASVILPKPGTTYSFLLTTGNGYRQTPCATIVTAQSTPAAPTITLLATGTTGSHQITVSWGPVSGVQATNGYKLFWSTSNVIEVGSSPSATASGTSVAVSSLTTGTLYYFAVAAQDPSGFGSLSSVQMSIAP